MSLYGHAAVTAVDGGCPNAHLALALVYVLVHMCAGLATSSGLGPRGRDGFGSPGDGSRLDPKCKLIFCTVYIHIYSIIVAGYSLPKKVDC